MDILRDKKPNFKKLVKYGFKKNGKNYIYSKNFLNDEFKFVMTISDDVSVEVIENAFNEVYTLHLVEGIQGTFVGQVKEQYENILSDIVQNCFDINVFKSITTNEVIEFVREKYADEPEYLWEKFPNNAVFRRKDNSKWYAAILTVVGNKLGLDRSEIVEVIDLRAEEDELNTLVDNEKYFRGYHMNKKHWLTIVLDGSVPKEEIFTRIAHSYELARKK